MSGTARRFEVFRFSTQVRHRLCPVRCHCPSCLRQRLCPVVQLAGILVLQVQDTAFPPCSTAAKTVFVTGSFIALVCLSRPRTEFQAGATR